MGDGSITASAGKDDGAVETQGLRCEIKSLLLRQKKGEIEIVEKNSKITDDDPYNKYALVSKQSFDENHKLTGTTLERNPSKSMPTGRARTFMPRGMHSKSLRFRR